MASGRKPTNHTSAAVAATFSGPALELHHFYRFDRRARYLPGEFR